MRGRAIDAATRESLLTPEEREARRLAEAEQLREFEEARASRRAQINAQFSQVYSEYEHRWVSTQTTTTTADGEPVFTFVDRMTLDSFGNLHYDKIGRAHV